MAITFEEVTSNAGIAFAGRSYGAAWGDFNNDSFPDLWVNNHFGSGRTLYLNQGNGSFTDVTAEVFLAEELSGDFHGSAWADFDNDGDQDLVQLQSRERGGTNLPPDSGPNLMFINDEGVLRDQARTLGLAYDSAKAQIPVWWDFDNDGLLDLFHSSTQRPDGLNPPTVFRQTGDGFEDVGSTLLPPEVQSQTIRYGVLSDLSGDGNLELILPPAKVILDTTSTPFTDITTSLLTNPNLLNASDVATADFNNDLRPDLYLARGGNDRLLLNSDQGLIDSSNEAGINNLSNAVSVVAADLDNDMDLDVYTVRATSDNLPNLLLENQGDGTFIAVSDAGGAAGSSIGKGDHVVTADYDLDGFLDLFVTNGAGAATDGPQQLFRNQGNNNNWLEIDLEGVESNRDGIGAQVFLTAGGITQLREQSGGVHRWSQNNQRIHFGLAENTQVDLLEIRWPSGTVQQLENIAANQLLTITEEDNSNGTPPPINGTDGNDSLVGTAGDDIINGLDGKDTINGLEGNDTIDGGDVRDILFGGDGNDSLIGDAGNDNLKGNEGNDTLTGGAGNDVLNGSKGNDSLTGAEGSDRFRFFDSTHGVDTITDFAPTEDSLEFVASNFGGGLVPGVLAENQFILGTAAEDSTHRFIYDQSTGNLFFDVDGNGNSDQIWMATLSNQAAVNFDDIAIV